MKEYVVFVACTAPDLMADLNRLAAGGFEYKSTVCLRPFHMANAQPAVIMEREAHPEGQEEA
ncbi:MAG TPA: hypothetical protein VMY40_01955 [Anaerolineae bacterium]|nr:hypothetical protein [Anaerolineae bacterium]